MGEELELEELSKSTRRSSKAAAIKDAILRSATELFDKAGYANVKMSHIAANAGLTTGAVYYYFDSKDEILDLVASHYIERVSAIAEEVYLRPGLGPDEKIVLLIREHCAGVARYRAHLSVFYREYNHLSPESLARAVEMNTRFLQYTTNIIEDGVAAGKFKAGVDPKVAALGIIGMCNWMYQWYKADGKYNSEEIADFFVKLTVEGLRT